MRHVFAMRAGILAAVWLLCLAAGLPAQSVDMSITHIPATLQPGGNSLIRFHYARDAQFIEKRLVFVVEVRSTSDDAVLRSVTFDNNGQGYPNSDGMLSFAYGVPADIPGIYFKTYASPWSMNKWVVEQFESYPTNGTWRYEWPGGGFGVTQDIYYLGSLIAPKPPNDTTYCSGIAFEVGVLSYLNYNALYGHPTIGGMNVTQMQRFRRVWYGVISSDNPDPDLKLAALAIPEHGIGREITNWDEVQPGDFLQFWRTSGSGHNPIFVSWVTNASGTRTGIRYWGSQGSTNGLGYLTERFTGQGGSIDPTRTYFGRIARPRDGNDIDHALVTMSTEDNPIILIPPQVRLNGLAVY